jgi:hypothetical protein
VRPSAKATFAPFWSYCPRIRTNVSRGFGISCITIAVGIFASIDARSDLSAATFAARAFPSAETFDR